MHQAATAAGSPATAAWAVAITSAACIPVPACREGFPVRSGHFPDNHFQVIRFQVGHLLAGRFLVNHSPAGRLSRDVAIPSMDYAGRNFALATIFAGLVSASASTIVDRFIPGHTQGVTVSTI